MMLGRETTLPPLWEFGDIMPAEFVTTNYVAQLQDRLSDIHTDYRNLRGQTTHFDISTHRPYVVNQWVWLREQRRYEGVSPKLQARYLGPYQVIKVFTYDTYQVKHKTTGKLRTEHFSRLKPVKSLGNPGPVFNLEGSDATNSDSPVDAETDNDSDTDEDHPLTTKSGRAVRPPARFEPD
jgi:hypothetical protein